MADIPINSQIIKHSVYLNHLIKGNISKFNYHQKNSSHISARSENPKSSNSFEIGNTNPFSYFPSNINKLSQLFYKKSRGTMKKSSSPGKVSQGSLMSDEILPKITKNTPIKKKPSFDTDNYEDYPTTHARWEHTERIFWKKRKITGLKLVVLVFEGILGDFYKKNFWEFKTHDFYLSPAWIHGLLKLAKGAFVALVSTGNAENLRFLVDYFSLNKVFIDAVYKKKGDLPRQSLDIVQILDDFHAKNCVVCSTVGIDATELDERDGWDLVYESCAPRSKRVLMTLCSVNSGCFNLFFPNPRAQPADSAILFTEIVDLILRVLKGNDSCKTTEKLCAEGVFKKVVFDIEKISPRTGDCIAYICSGKSMKKKKYSGYVLSHLKTEIDLQRLLKKASI